jgi:hypothetical protein
MCLLLQIASTHHTITPISTRMSVKQEDVMLPLLLAGTI